MSIRYAISRAGGLYLLALFIAASAATADGLVFELGHAGTTRGFLVGTMHSEDPRVTALTDRIRPLVDEVDAVALEIVPDASSLVAVGAATLLPPDQRLRDLTGPRRYRALTEAAGARGVPAAVLDRLKPWAAAVLLGMPAPETGRFLDIEIYQAALDLGRRVTGLETVAEQLAVFDDMAPGLQLELLDEVVADAGRLDEQVEELTRVYLEGDLERLASVSRAQYADSSPAVRDWFDDRVVRQRNRRMAERLHAMLRNERVLAAVGAMHLAGDSGLVAQLRRAGFTVERLQP